MCYNREEGTMTVEIKEEKVAYINPPGTVVDESQKLEVINEPNSVNRCKQDDNSQ